ncbi:MAG: ATPase, T2SS/T4P/T4SS family, partial [Patescibacteria group bacterium]
KTGEGYTFAQGLRSILRQDPDVIMVGEIRDLDTADTAINAALTGHLVLSTLHTNSAAATIPRFLSMGVKPFLLAPALNAMIGQRLVRRICPDCKKSAQLDNQTLSAVMKALSTMSAESGEHHRVNDAATLQFFHGQGCPACRGIGYKGRIGIYEIMTMTPEIEKLILSGQVSEYQMEELAVKAGMVTMVQDGLLKALDGLTTVEEVFRVAKSV